MKKKKTLERVLRVALIFLSLGLLTYGIYAWVTTQPAQPAEPTKGYEVTYLIDGKECNKQFYAEGDKLQLPRSPDTSGLTYYEWYNENNEKLCDGIEITDNLVLHGNAIKGLGFKFSKEKTMPYGDVVITLQEYVDSNTSVTVPSSYSLLQGIAIEGNDYTVTQIGTKRKISGQSNKIVFPDTVTEVTLPETITSICDNAFGTKLEKLYVNSNAAYHDLTNYGGTGALFENEALKIYVNSSVDDGMNSYLNDNYDKSIITVNEVEYNLYTLKVNVQTQIDISFIKKLGNQTTGAQIDKKYESGSTIENFPNFPNQITIYHETLNEEITATFVKWEDDNGNEVTSETVVTRSMFVYAIYEYDYITKMVTDFENETTFNAYISDKIWPLYEQGKAEIYGLFEGGIECKVVDGTMENVPESDAPGGYAFPIGYKYKILN